jgi:hypothetical protein
MVDGAFPPVSTLLILFVWGAAGSALAARWLRWD